MEFTTSTQQAINRFLAATQDLSSSSEEFDKAYDRLSEEIPNFEQFELACMHLGLA